MSFNNSDHKNTGAQHGTGSAKKKPVNCDTCQYYIYDEGYGSYVCDVDLDEDETYKFITGTFRDCPYYRLYDEYAIVRKQN